jgi:hypothetical protein
MKLHRSLNWKNTMKNKSDEERDIIKQRNINNLKEYYKNENKEQQQKRIEKSKMSERNKSQEEKELIVQKRKNTINNKSEEERIRTRKKISETLRNKSDEEKEIRSNNIRNALKNMSEEAKKEKANKTSIYMKEYMAAMPYKKKQKRYKKSSISHKKYWDLISPKQRFHRMKPLLEAQNDIGPTEIDFNNYLKNHLGLFEDINYKMGYDTYPYINGEYYNYFTDINPITKEITYPYKKWDFIIYSKNDNNILIDIDGSIHDPNKNNHVVENKKTGVRFVFGDNIKYYESKRIFQIPSNQYAYVILAYDDKLGNNIVLDIKNNKQISYKTLLEIIQLSQLSKKEINKVMES